MSKDLTNPRPPAKFAMFVRLFPGIPSHFPGIKRTFCYRGDKWYDEEKMQLRSLLSLVKKSLDKFELLELYDNHYSKDQEQRLVLKIFQGVVHINRLHYMHYAEMLQHYPLADFLQPIKK